MSKLAEYRQLEKHLAEQLQALEKMKADDGLKNEIEFETKRSYASCLSTMASA